MRSAAFPELERVEPTPPTGALTLSTARWGAHLSVGDMSLWSLSGTLAAGVAAAKEPTDVPIQSHVDKPAKQVPSAATTQTLKVPPGLRNSTPKAWANQACSR